MTRTFSLLLRCTLLLGVLAPALLTHGQEDGRVVTISPPGASYVDPEILPGGSLMAYQSQGDIYLAQLDNETGLFVTPHGDDLLVDRGGARLLETFNGPEFGIDANGWALYYAKPHDGVVQVWRATVASGGQVEAVPITSGVRHQTQLVSRNPTAASTQLVAIQGTWESGMAVWFDADNPADVSPITPIENGVNPVRWVDNSSLMTFSERSGPDRGQIVLLDTATNTRQTITADAGDKTDPYGWYAPEFGGEMLVLAIVDDSAVAVYRDTGGPAWERIATLMPPQESNYIFVSSAEPFTVDGRSYMSLIIKSAESNRQRFDDSEVWIFDLNADSDTRYAERCDSGEMGVARSDPEVFVGSENVFVYYNVISGGDAPYEIRRCRSSLPVGNAPDETVSTRQTVSQPVTADGAANCEWVAPQVTDTRIDTELEPHYVCQSAEAQPRDQLLVFFPGTGGDPDDYEYFVEEAAALGMHAIGLSYVNPRSVNLQICPRDPDPDCHEKGRREVIYGEDLHSDMTIDEANSILNRLVQLLRYLDENEPTASWDQYLDGDTPRWDRIVVSGHSQGAGMAAYLTHEYAVARSVLFAWVDVRRGVVAPWILEPHATPADRIFYFEHVDDHQRGFQAKQDMLSAFGIDALGRVTIDEMTPPYDQAHVLLTQIEPVQTGTRRSAAAHNVVIVDDFTPVDDGTPVLRDIWQYLLIGADNAAG